MLKRNILLLINIFIGFLFISCSQADPSSLKDTMWECSENGTILMFKDNVSGIYLSKGAINDVFDPIFSSFDFHYEVNGDEIIIQVFFTGRTFVMDGVIEGNVITTNGTLNQRHYIKIEHKVPI